MVGPETINETAEKVYNTGIVDCRVEESGFVLQHSLNRQNCTFVGVRVDEDEYIVGKMWKDSEIVGRNEPRMKPTENTYVRCEFYRMNIEEVSDTDRVVEDIGERIEEGDYIEKMNVGWLNGYRVTSLDDAVDEVFEYYSS